MKELLFIWLLFPGLCLSAQPGQPKDSSAQVFYRKTAGRPVWFTTTGRKNFDLLHVYLQNAVYLGLNTNDYNPALIKSLTDNIHTMQTVTDTLQADISITETAIQFFHDVAYGRLTRSPVKYNGAPPFQHVEANIAAQLADSILAGQFPHFLACIEPSDTTYKEIKNSILALYSTITDTAFKEVLVTSLKADSSNTPLLLRLKQIGVSDTISGTLRRSLPEDIRKAQQLFNTLDDGIVRDKFLKALNVPLAHRLQELFNSLNLARWLHYYKTQASVVLVNIPSASLVFYDHEKPALYSRVITGKKSTPTPTLSSCITEVILFPYWTVPNKIAVRELLPHIKLDRQYLTDNQYEILDKRGHIVDPATIDWAHLSANNFPYVIRQNTGCDNSLGIVKLNFYSPFGVYLHDTPGKNLFMLPQRFFSHGCVRVEDAVQLAHLLLEKEATTMITLEANGSQPDQKPVVFKVRPTTYVFILYNTAWPDATGKIRFYEDVYDLN